MALVMHLVAETAQTVTELLETIPRFIMIKEKMVCPSDKIAAVLRTVRRQFANYPIDLRDGVKVTLPNGWLLVRGSNTEPIVRVIVEARSEADAKQILASVYPQLQSLAST